MPEERPIIEEVLDLALYTPIGLALTVLEDLPKLVERGRRQVSGQFGVARFVAEYATIQMRKKMDAFLATPVRDEVVQPERPARAPSQEDVVRPSSSHLAIAGYDSLAASQIVARLATLSPDEREAVREYESATRRRQTILNRIAQLEHPDV